MKISKKCVMALASFALLMLQAFGLKIDAPIVNELIAAAASVLVMLGIITDSHIGGGSAGGTSEGEKSENEKSENEKSEEKTEDSVSEKNDLEDDT